MAKTGSMVRIDFKNANGLWVKNYSVDKKSLMTKAGMLWYNMEKRCNNFRIPVQKTYRDCRMSDNFSDFQYFAEWCQNQKGYKEGYALDKDILIIGNKTYSENTCLFIPDYINSLVIKPSVDKALPTGVFKYDFCGKFLACLNNRGHEHLGVFESVELASTAYRKRKSEIFIEVANDIKEDITLDDRVYVALLNWSNYYAT